MKIFKQNHNGQASLLIIGQDEADAAYLNQLMGHELLGVNESAGGQMRLRLLVDLKSAGKPRPKDKFSDRSVEDLLDMAARRNLNVPRNILRDDLEAILLTYEEDEDEARKLIEIARPAAAKSRHNEVKSQAGASAFRTFNDKQASEVSNL